MHTFAAYLSTILISGRRGLRGPEGRGPDSAGHAARGGQLPAGAQVRHLDPTLAQQQVGWLDVPVRYPLVVYWWTMGRFIVM